MLLLLVTNCLTIYHYYKDYNNQQNINKYDNKKFTLDLLNQDIKFILEYLNKDININDLVLDTMNNTPDILQYLKLKINECHHKMYKCYTFYNQLTETYDNLLRTVKLYEKEREDKLIFTNLDVTNIFANAQKKALERIFEDLEYSRLYNNIKNMKLDDMPEMKVFIEEYCNNFGCEFINH